MKKPITDKQRLKLVAEGIPSATCDLLTTASGANILHDVWRGCCYPMDPVNNKEHEAICDRLVAMGFPPRLVIRFSKATADGILNGLPSTPRPRLLLDEFVD